MAKKRKAAVNGFEPSEYFASMLQAAEKSTGVKGVYAAACHGQYYWGVDLQVLPLKHVMGGSNILPYGQVIAVEGMPASMKTTLGLEFGRLISDAMGLTTYYDAESKTSPEWFPAVIGREPVDRGQIHVVPGLETVEEWQAALVDRLHRKLEVDPEGRAPTLYILDAVNSRGTADDLKALEKDGVAAGRGYPIAALSITNFMKSYMPLLLRDKAMSWPVVIIFISHLKVAPESTSYAPRYNAPGGKHKEYQYSVRLRMKKIGDEQYTAAYINARRPTRFREEGIEFMHMGEMRRLQIDNEKSSIGPDGRRITVELFWGWDREQRQYAWFDWDGALINMMLQDENIAKSIGIRVSKGGGAKFSVSADGFEGISGVSITEAGIWINEQTELVSRLEDYYHVTKRCTHFCGESSDEAYERHMAGMAAAIPEGSVDAGEP